MATPEIHIIGATKITKKVTWLENNMVVTELIVHTEDGEALTVCAFGRRDRGPVNVVPEER